MVMRAEAAGGTATMTVGSTQICRNNIGIPREMTATMFGRRIFAYSLCLCAAIPAKASFAYDLQAEPTEAEKVLAAKIKCEDFRKNADGSWTSGPKVMIGANAFSNSTFGVGDINQDGADFAVV